VSETSTEKVLKLQAYIADTVRAFKKQHRMSHAQFGARVGMSADRVARIQKGHCELRVRDLLKLAPTLDAPASQIMRLAGL
jgi:transcriptional regulator with XRE-family HTH domain